MVSDPRGGVTLGPYNIILAAAAIAGAMDGSHQDAASTPTGLRQRRVSLSSDKKRERESSQIAALVSMTPPSLAIYMNKTAPYFHQACEICKQIVDFVGPLYIALAKGCAEGAEDLLARPPRRAGLLDIKWQRGGIENFLLGFPNLLDVFG